MTEIVRKRGDTYAEQLTVTDTSGAAMNIAGYTFVLTVDPNKYPTSAATNLFSIAGTIITPAAGTVEFVPTLANADQTPGRYYYDIQMTDDAGRIRTIDSGDWVVIQDISK